MEKITIMLDKTYNNIGYLCGRLAAVLQKFQEDADGTSIRTKYLCAASITPSVVFPDMIRLYLHYSEKLSNEKLRRYYEKIVWEIYNQIIPTGFPTKLDFEDQGRFFIGYYHQRIDLFTKKEDKTVKTE